MPSNRNSTFFSFLFRPLRLGGFPTEPNQTSISALCSPTWRPAVIRYHGRLLGGDRRLPKTDCIPIPRCRTEWALYTWERLWTCGHDWFDAKKPWVVPAQNGVLDAGRTASSNVLSIALQVAHRYGLPHLYVYVCTGWSGSHIASRLGTDTPEQAHVNACLGLDFTSSGPLRQTVFRRYVCPINAAVTLVVSRIQ